MLLGMDEFFLYSGFMMFMLKILDTHDTKIQVKQKLKC